MCKWPASVPTASVVPYVALISIHAGKSSGNTIQTFCTHATELMVSPVALKSHNLETAAL